MIICERSQLERLSSSRRFNPIRTIGSELKRPHSVGGISWVEDNLDIDSEVYRRVFIFWKVSCWRFYFIYMIERRKIVYDPDCHIISVCQFTCSRTVSVLRSATIASVCRCSSRAVYICCCVVVKSNLCIGKVCITKISRYAYLAKY